MHNDEDRGVRDEIRKALNLPTKTSDYLLQSLVKTANTQYKEHEAKRGLLRRRLVDVRLHTFWAALFLFISLIGLVIVFTTLISP